MFSVHVVDVGSEQAVALQGRDRVGGGPAMPHFCTEIGRSQVPGPNAKSSGVALGAGENRARAAPCPSRTARTGRTRRYWSRMRGASAGCVGLAVRGRTGPPRKEVPGMPESRRPRGHVGVGRGWSFAQSADRCMPRVKGPASAPPRARVHVFLVMASARCRFSPAVPYPPGGICAW